MQGSEVVFMDIGTTSALGLYNYPTTLNGYGQGTTSASASPNSSISPSSSSTSSTGSAQDAAVLQALTDTYTSLTTSSNGLNALLGSSNVLGPLVSGIYSESAANGQTPPDLTSLAASAASVGGLNSASASILFSGNSKNGLDNISSSAINLNATVALAAYYNQQNDISNSTATTSAAPAVTGTGSPQSSDVKLALQSAQSALLNSTLNLFA
jgi:hypothetical protein